jgi:glutamate N-acetyltransferase / amino-acid N-acetyltransferase
MFLSFLPSGGITSAQGFKAWGEHVGLKKFKKDMALIVSEVPAVFAGVFTTNKAKAAPVLWNEAILAQGNSVQAILVNSGQANSCTGPQGVLNASLMAEKAAEALGCATSAVLLASTGIIGTQIKMPEALHGIAKVAANLRADAFAANAAAEAIVTTDSYTKQCTVAFEVNGVKVTLGAMAKGSGMIHPNMATMLSFIATDIAITPALLRKALKASIKLTT